MHVIDEHPHLVAVEDVCAREQVERDTADGIDVGAAIDIRAAKNHLRRHIGGSSDQLLLHTDRRVDQIGGRFFTTGFHETEVEHLDEVEFETHATYKDVGRFDVAMHHPASVRLGQ